MNNLERGIAVVFNNYTPSNFWVYLAIAIIFDVIFVLYLILWEMKESKIGD